MLPSLDEIRAKLVSLIQTPARNIAFALQFAATKLTRVFNEYSKLDVSDKATDATSSNREKTPEPKLAEKMKKKPDDESKSTAKPEVEKS